MPKSRLEYWAPKFATNVERDLKNQQELERLGWTFMVVWECELKNLSELTERIVAFLGPSAKKKEAHH